MSGSWSRLAAARPAGLLPSPIGAALTFAAEGRVAPTSVFHHTIGRLVSGQLANVALKGPLVVEGPFESHISADAIEGLPCNWAHASGCVGESPG